MALHTKKKSNSVYLSLWCRFNTWIIIIRKDQVLECLQGISSFTLNCFHVGFYMKKSLSEMLCTTPSFWKWKYESQWESKNLRIKLRCVKNSLGKFLILGMHLAALCLNKYKYPTDCALWWETCLVLHERYTTWNKIIPIITLF